jgi:hypothetical protein
VGNHEVENNRTREARENAARFLSPIDPVLSPERLYYRKDFGPAAFLFLDTNDLVYGDDGSRATCPSGIESTSRAGAQLAWLREELARLEREPKSVVIAVLHHPPIQSSKKHREASRSLWNLRDDGSTLVDLLIDGGVDLLLTGHTHTHERFRLRRADGREIDLVNLSGRPRNDLLWFGAAPRRARDLRGREKAMLAESGWLDLDRWEITQTEAMLADDADQFAIVTIGPDGGLWLEARFLEDDGSFRRGETIRLR